MSGRDLTFFQQPGSGSEIVIFSGRDPGSGFGFHQPGFSGRDHPGSKIPNPGKISSRKFRKQDFGSVSN